MGFMRVTQDTEHALRLAPGPEYRAAPGLAALLGVLCLGGAGLMLRDDASLVFLLFIASLMLLFVAGLLRSRMREVEIDLSEGVFYLFGRRPSDVALLPFSDVETLRIARARRAGTSTETAGQAARCVPVPEGRPPLTEDGACHAGAPRTGTDTAGGDADDSPGGRSGAHPGGGGRHWELSVILRDGGSVGIDRSIRAEEMASLGELLARRTGLGLEDLSPVGRDVEATVSGPAGPGEAPADPPPGSCITQVSADPGWQWSASPGGPALGLMAFSGGSLACAAGYGLMLMLERGVDIDMVTLVLVSAFFTHLVMGRLLRGLFGGGWLAVRGRTLATGDLLFMRKRTLWELPLAEAAHFRVTSPVLGPTRLDCVTKGGDVLPLACVTPGFSVVTPGDLHWLAGRLRGLVAPHGR